jgi:hypothetical protein
VSAIYQLPSKFQISHLILNKQLHAVMVPVLFFFSFLERKAYSKDEGLTWCIESARRLE